MSIIIKPIVTEKVTREGELTNRFGFVVDKRANKVQIKKAVEAAYNVTIVG
ncbi:MAG: 50S ribosomal protein L23, partial [Proteobacteria bacterium]